MSKAPHVRLLSAGSARFKGHRTISSLTEEASAFQTHSDWLFLCGSRVLGSLHRPGTLAQGSAAGFSDDAWGEEACAHADEAQKSHRGPAVAGLALACVGER